MLLFAKTQPSCSMSYGNNNFRVPDLMHAFFAGAASGWEAYCVLWWLGECCQLQDAPTSLSMNFSNDLRALFALSACSNLQRARKCAPSILLVLNYDLNL